MSNLLKFELHKLIRQKSFYICTAIILLMCIITFVTDRLIADTLGLGSLTGSPSDGMLEAVSVSAFPMICGIFISIFICDDYNQQTIKNIYSRGFSRIEVFFAKYIVALIATVVMFFITILVSLLMGLAVFNGETQSGNYFGLMAGQFVYCIAYISIVFAINIMVRKVGVSIAFTIVGPSLISLILVLIDAFFFDAFLKLDNFALSNYWISSFLTDLGNLSTDTKRLVICIVLSIVYGAIFMTGAFFVNRRRDG